MKILMLGWELPPHNSGGLGVACLHMSKALAKEGASIDFVVPYRADHPHTEFMTIHSATELSPLHRFGMSAYDTPEALSSERNEAQARDIRSIQKQYVSYVKNHIIPTHQYNAVHAHDWLTIEAGMAVKELTGAPLIVHVHATEFDRAGSNYGNSLVHDIEYAGLIAADRIIAVSEITKKIIVERYEIPADKIEVVHNALSTDELKDFPYDKHTYRYLESLKADGYTVVGTVTRFTVQKGLIHFVKAAARALERYEKLVFLLAGDGELRDELLRLGAEYGIADKLFFTGFVRGKQWRDAFNVSDVFVMSSVSEPFGITALEAAYHECALVITKQSGAGEVLSSIYRYDFWDTDALADRLIMLATSKALQKTMKANAKDEYSELSWDKVARRCLKLYKKVATKRIVA